MFSLSVVDASYFVIWYTTELFGKSSAVFPQKVVDHCAVDGKAFILELDGWMLS